MKNLCEWCGISLDGEDTNVVNQENADMNLGINLM